MPYYKSTLTDQVKPREKILANGGTLSSAIRTYLGSTDFLTPFQEPALSPIERFNRFSSTPHNCAHDRRSVQAVHGRKEIKGSRFQACPERGKRVQKLKPGTGASGVLSWKVAETA